MARRPITFTILFWLLVGLAQTGLLFSCGFGAGWDEESHQRIVDCQYGAQIWIGYLNFAAILAYSIWAVVTIKRLVREGAE